MIRLSATTATTVANLKLKRANPKEQSNPKLTPCFSTPNLKTNSNSIKVTRIGTLMFTATPPPRGQHPTQPNSSSSLTQRLSRPTEITTLIISSITLSRHKQLACLHRITLTNITLITLSTLSITISSTLTRTAANLTSKQPTHYIKTLIRAHTSQPAQVRSLTKAKDGDASGAEPKDDNEVKNYKS
jgi:hypothetical protein